MKDNKVKTKSDLLINSNGQLCEILELENCTFINVFNSLTDHPYVGISFSFNPLYINRKQGW